MDREEAEVIITTFEPRCAFCSGVPVLWRYPATPFSNELGISSDGKTVMGQTTDSWAACQTCHGLIEAGNQAEVIRRSLETLDPETRFIDPAGVLKLITDLVEGFWRNRTGPPRSARQ